MNFLIQLAFVDNGISEEEDKVLQLIASALQIHLNIYQAMKSRFENMNQNKPESMSAKIKLMKF